MTCEAVLVMVHSHEIRKDNDEEADYFLEEFAHACIDAGASAVIGGGTHQLKGIELYHDCPIFYCLGNFIFENQYVRLLPADYMEKYGLNIHTASIHRNRQAAGAVLTFPLRNSGGLSECAAVFRDLSGKCTHLELL
ncbi:MAG: CapA family protein [Lachnospiraceae bacterium]